MQKLKMYKLIPINFSIDYFLENVCISLFGNVWTPNFLVMVHLDGAQLPVAHMILPCSRGS